MRKNTLRRGAAAFAVAVGIMAITSPGAQAGKNGLGDILNGRADAQAIKITLQLPSTTQLNAALAELGIPANVLPNGLLGATFTQVISLNGAEVKRSLKGTSDHASGFAAPLQGLLSQEKITTRCDAPVCGGSEASGGIELKVLDGIIPGGLGTIKIAPALSKTASLIDTRNETGLAHVDLSLANLFKVEAFAPLADALNTLRGTVNDTVLPTVNPILEQVGDTIAGILEGTALEDAVKVGGINPIPDVTKMQLLNLDVMKSFANVYPHKPAGSVKGLLAESHAKITDLNILGDWATVDVVGLTTSAFANGKRGNAFADADVDVLGADLGGLLELGIPVSTLQALGDGSAVKDVIENLGLPANVTDELLATIDLVYNTAGITIDAFGKTTKVDPKGHFASATAGTLAITVEPAIPNLTKADLADLSDGIIPDLDKSDFVKLGLKVKVELPQSSAAVSEGAIEGETFPPPPTTGVGTPLLAGIALIGSAVLVRRFALAA